MISPYGDVYEGEVKNGQPFGKGRLSFGGKIVTDAAGRRASTGNTKGEFKEGTWALNDHGQFRLHGPGAWKNRGVLMTGTFVLGVLTGKGSVTFPSGQVYRGVWVSNRHLLVREDAEKKVAEWCDPFVQVCYKGTYMRHRDRRELKPEDPDYSSYGGISYELIAGEVTDGNGKVTQEKDGRGARFFTRECRPHSSGIFICRND